MRVAIVEDQLKDFELLQSYLHKYGKENGISIEMEHFSNGLNFIEDYHPDFDIVFMDIEMPHLGGLEAARRLRIIDEEVALIFVTNMLQYAINGYEVNAIDFIVKPVSYFNFQQKLTKARKHLHYSEEKKIVVHANERTQTISMKEIYYIDKDKNYLLFHTSKGVFRERGTIGEMEQELADAGFSKCVSSCLVNLAHVSEIRKDTLVVQGEVIPISRRQKKDFMIDFARHFGGAM